MGLGRMICKLTHTKGRILALGNNSLIPSPIMHALAGTKNESIRATHWEVLVAYVYALAKKVNFMSHFRVINHGL